MKKILIAFVILIMITTVAYAGVFDSVKGFVSGMGWTAIALGLSALLAIGGVATKAKWFSAICIAVGSLLTNIGVSLQDGKIEKEEITQIKENIATAWNVIKTKT